MVDEATFTLDRSVRNQIRHNPMRLVAVLVRTDVGTARLDRNMGKWSSHFRRDNAVKLSYSRHPFSKTGWEE
jgi:hypothetical protein